jgi:hypothetical protein
VDNRCDRLLSAGAHQIGQIQKCPERVSAEVDMPTRTVVEGT